METYGGIECSMCGDVGFSSELLRCHRCDFRWQHSYCSKFYPEMSENWVCDWCLAAAGKESTRATSRQKRGASNNCKTEQQDCKRWDALELLLEVAQSCATQTSDGDSPTCCGVVERQACCSKRTSARKLSLKKHQKWGLVSEKMITSPSGSGSVKLDDQQKRHLSSSSTSRTRYKLLADV